MTVWEAYCKANDNESDEFIELESFVGRKVRHIVYGYKDLQEASETWSETVHVIESFDDDVCGDGCCNGFTISGHSRNLSWRTDQLKLED